MIDKKMTVVVICCVAALAGCGQEARQPAPVTEQSSGNNTEATSSKSGLVYEGTITGVISDSMCGKDHAGMGELGKDPAACTKACVGKGARYVLVDKTSVVYNLSDQEKPQEFAGKPVSIEGHIDPTERAIHVHSMAAQ